MKIKLNSIEKVVWFVKQMSHIDARVYLVSQGIKVDAKSILAILSVDITKPFEVEVQSGDYDMVYRFIHSYYYD